jgi:hypothetical protein
MKAISFWKISHQEILQFLNAMSLDFRRFAFLQRLIITHDHSFIIFTYLWCDKKGAITLSIMTLSIIMIKITLSVVAVLCYAECRVFDIVMLRVIMLSVVMLIVVMLIVVILIVLMLSVVMLNAKKSTNLVTLQ